MKCILPDLLLLLFLLLLLCVFKKGHPKGSSTASPRLLHTYLGLTQDAGVGPHGGPQRRPSTAIGHSPGCVCLSDVDRLCVVSV